MAILNYTTKIDHFKTIGEINKILVAHGSKKIITDYDNLGFPSAITFSHTFLNKEVTFSLPAKYDGVMKAMEKQKVPKTFINKEQAVRVSWRIIKDWIEAQMAIVEAELAEFSEVFLPYAVTKDGSTLYDSFKGSSNNNLLTN